VAVVNRRSFFGLLASGAAALGVKPWWSTASPPAVKSLDTFAATPMSDARAKISMDQYTSEAFAPRVGEVFSFHRTVDANNAPIRLELVEVEASPHRGKSGSRQPFSLLFRLRSDEATQESTLHLRHDEFAPCAWFLNRVVAPGRDPQAPHYEAVFG
jgi:hypothetical protein